MKTSEVLISFRKSKLVPIKTFFKTNANQWNYFLAYINLLADLCMDRNSEAIENVSSILSLQNVVTILFDDEIESINRKIRNELNRSTHGSGLTSERTYQILNVHQPFVRIAHHVYINNDKFAPISTVKKIRLWHKKTDDGLHIEEIRRTKRQFEG